MIKILLRYCMLIAVYFCLQSSSYGQAYTSLEIPSKDKPEKYADKELKAEKTDEGPIKGFKSYMQGLTTHFNYIFNANQRIDRIINEATNNYVDDYSHLLPFYNYNAKNVAQNRYWDTVINKATAGLVLHDLKNKWVDEVYLVLGKAFFYQQKIDTAILHLQYLNYAFAPKDDGWDIPLASNSQENGTINISTKESKKIWEHRPRRNDGLIWLGRALVANGDYGAAQGILQMLAIDPNLPKREKPDLAEALSYLYYNEQKYDSAAHYLSQCITNAPNTLAKCRRAFLAGQLYALANDSTNSYQYFSYAAKKTPNLLMEIYSELNAAIWEPSSNELSVEKKLQALAAKGKYHQSKDLIYYLIGQYQLKDGREADAKSSFTKSIQSSEGNIEQKSRSFYALAQLERKEFNFEKWSNYYDSIESPSSVFNQPIDEQNFANEKQNLRSIASNLVKIHKNDSLIAISKLPKNQQTALLKKELKAIRHRLGLKDQENFYNPVSVTSNTNSQQMDLFTTKTKGEWYFNNEELKSKGYQSFKMMFGNRPNVDNWNRITAIKNNPNTAPQNIEQTSDGSPKNDAIDSSYLTIEDLRLNIPQSDSERNALIDDNANYYYSNATIFQDKLGFYPEAIYSFHLFQHLSNNTSRIDESLFKLYQCAMLSHNRGLADSIQTVLTSKNKESLLSLLIKSQKKDEILPSSEQEKATQTYLNVYNLLLQGSYDSALAVKKEADKTYGNHYWTPQLLFVEAISDVAHRHDSVAISKLQLIQHKYSFSPISNKAKSLIDVLNRRDSIETYLTNLKIEPRNDSDENKILPIEEIADLRRDTSTSLITAKTEKIAKPTSQPQIIENKNLLNVIQPKTNEKSFDFDGSKEQYVAILLDKVAPTFVKEVVSSFVDYSKQLMSLNVKSSTTILNDQYTLVLLGPFSDGLKAYNYWTKIEPNSSKEIIPWLDKSKYRFLLISDYNLELLKENKNVDGYKAVLNKAFPNKF